MTTITMCSWNFCRWSIINCTEKKAVCEEVNQKGEGNEKEDAGKDKRARRTKLQAGVALGMLEQEKKDSKSEE